MSEALKAAQALLAEREQIGIGRYGQTVDRADLSLEDWIEHARQEAGDLPLYLEAVKREASKLRAAHAWQPIETAPRDGTPVLYFCPLQGIWQGNHPEGHWRGKWTWYEGDRRWGGCSLGDNLETHWMPLPPRPETEAADA